jgi:site-specific DNA-methyltransferase (cytosine-N4-specific)
MNPQYQTYYDYIIEHVLTPFYDKRLEELRKMSLDNILSRKNPYLFRAKNIGVAGELVKSAVDAFLSSQEETIFGNLLEGFAIFVSRTIDGGFKSELKSVDLEFTRKNVYYIVGIKSGTNWGNSDQINAMKDNFKKARQILRNRGITTEIVAVNGCMYGNDPNLLKNKRNRGKEDEEPDKVYYKLAGQVFWHFLSGDDNLYQEIIVPIDREAEKKDEVFKGTYDDKINELTEAFIGRFTTAEKRIDWVRLLDFVSKRPTVSQQLQLL